MSGKKEKIPLRLRHEEENKEKKVGVNHVKEKLQTQRTIIYQTPKEGDWEKSGEIKWVVQRL